MLYLNIEHLYGKMVEATDGEVGHITDVYFDEKTWSVRYVVVDTGTWLIVRKVVLPPSVFQHNALGSVQVPPTTLKTSLTRQQIQDSPPYSEQEPLSRTYEHAFYQYYGWPFYWEGRAGADFSEVPLLHSAQAITGFTVQARDGDVGVVQGFTIDSRTWALPELVVETGTWYSGKKILLLPENILRLDMKGSRIVVDLCKEDVSHTLRDDVVQPASVCTHE